MARILMYPLLVVGVLSVLARSGVAQTSTQNLILNTGNFSGAIGGQISMPVKSQTSNGSVQTRGRLSITDLDIATNSTGGPGINVFPNASSQNNTATTPINIAQTTLNISLPGTTFNSGVLGSISVTGNDQIVNGIPGVLDPGAPGSDGAWDAPPYFGFIPNAQLNNASVTMISPISSSAIVSGGPIVASIPNDVTIPNVVSGLIRVDLRVKRTSTVTVAFDPVQSVSIQNLSLSTTSPLPIDIEMDDQFAPGSHPASGATAMLDLSTGGGAIVNTQISGNLVSSIRGIVSAKVDIAADVRLDLGSLGQPLVGSFNQDNVINGPLSTGSLLDLNQVISLPDTQLPFGINIIHDANTNVDLDDVIVEILSGTAGFTFPIGITQPDVILPIPATNFLIANQSFAINNRLIDLPFGDGGDTFARGTVTLQRLEGNLSGNIVMDINANLNLSADLIAQALGQAKINVVPEPGSPALVCLATAFHLLFRANRMRRNGFVLSR